MKNQKFTAQELTTMALLAALLCLSSYISIQLPFSAVPITAQTLIVNLIALLLKPRKAGITVGIWILLGLVGLPVFSGGKGGFGVLAGPTGGYIIGYLVAVMIIALIRRNKNKAIRNMISTVVVGIPVVYAIGVPWFKVIAGLDWKTAVVTGLLPFIVGDIVKAVASVYIAKPLYKVVNTDYNEQKSASKVMHE